MGPAVGRTAESLVGGAAVGWCVAVVRRVRLIPGEGVEGVVDPVVSWGVLVVGAAAVVTDVAAACVDVLGCDVVVGICVVTAVAASRPAAVV